MSAFDDPQYMAQAKAEIRAYVETGQLSATMASGQPRITPDDPKPWRYWKDWELRAVAEALQKRPRFYVEAARRSLPHKSVKSIQNKVHEAGGRRAFLDKYVDL